MELGPNGVSKYMQSTRKTGLGPFYLLVITSSTNIHVLETGFLQQWWSCFSNLRETYERLCFSSIFPYRKSVRQSRNKSGNLDIDNLAVISATSTNTNEENFFSPRIAIARPKSGEAPFDEQRKLETPVMGSLGKNLFPERTYYSYHRKYQKRRSKSSLNL